MEVLWNSYSVILNLDPRSLSVTIDRNLNRLSLPVLHGVTDEVDDDLFKASLVPHALDVFLYVERNLASGGVEV